MPRTSYGDEKREQAWTIVSVLLDQKVDDHTERVMLQDLTVAYKDWESQDSPSIEVRGTLSALSTLCGENFSVEQVREGSIPLLHKQAVRRDN
jgi:hypothetical protein